MTVKDGGPAFPTPRNEFGENSSSMSLRDWFAGHAVCGLIAQTDRALSASVLAHEAFMVADAMLVERAKL